MKPPSKNPFVVVLRRHTVALAALAVFLACTAAWAEDWPLVRGDVRGSGATQSSIPAALEVLWTFKAPDDAGFDATTVIANGMIYVGDNAGAFHALKLADGTPVWSKVFEDGSFAAGAAIDADRIYVGDLNGIVRCLSTADGEQQWKTNIEGEVYAGPTVHGNDVLVTSETGTLSWLNIADGKMRLPQFKIDAPLRCTPTISANHVMLSGCDSLLHVINVADGTESHTVQIDGPTGATAAMRGKRVYFGTESGTFYAIDVPSEPVTEANVAWTYRDPRRSQPIRSAAAVSGDIVVYGSQGKVIYGLDPHSGEEKWKVSTRSRVESSPVIAEDTVIAATAAGKIYLIDAANGQVRWENDFGGGFIASPAVANGRVILGNTDGTLYCLGSKNENNISATENPEATEKKR